MWIATILQGREKYQYSVTNFIAENNEEAWKWLLKRLISEGKIFDIITSELRIYPSDAKDITFDEFCQKYPCWESKSMLRNFYNICQYIYGNDTCYDVDFCDIIFNNNDSWLNDGWCYNLHDTDEGHEVSFGDDNRGLEVDKDITF